MKTATVAFFTSVVFSLFIGFVLVWLTGGTLQECFLLVLALIAVQVAYDAKFGDEPWRVHRDRIQKVEP